MPKIESTDSRQGLTRIYVDPRAAGALANGSAQFPFKTLADALEVCAQPETLSSAIIPLMRTIVCNGYFPGVTVIDRPVSLIGPAYFEEISITSGMVAISEIMCPVVTVDGPMCRFNNLNIAESLTFTEDSTAVLNSCEILEITLEGTSGSIELHGCTVAEDVTIPAAWGFASYNSALTVASGDYVTVPPDSGGLASSYITVQTLAEGTINIAEGHAVKLVDNYTVTNALEADDTFFGVAMESVSGNSEDIRVKVRGILTFTYAGQAPEVDGESGVVGAAGTGLVQPSAGANARGMIINVNSGEGTLDVMV